MFDIPTRKNFIANVRQIWINQYLNKIPDPKCLLGMSYEENAIARPPRPISFRTELKATSENIFELFEKNGQSLLLLGEPSSGKTVTLLQLAEKLLTIAEENDSAPIPVIFNLASWPLFKQHIVTKALNAQRTQHRREVTKILNQINLANWLVERSYIEYGINHSIMKAISPRQFVYLLDGLDEMAVEELEICIEAINEFNSPIFTKKIVVCSRKGYYEQSRVKLNLETALTIHPLTEDQIAWYLQKSGNKMDEIQNILFNNKELQEIAKSPLFLNLMVSACKEDLKNFTPTLSHKPQRLLDFYVANILQQEPLLDSPYSQKEIQQGIINLAHGMYKTNQSMFFIELLSSDWLPWEASLMAKLITVTLFGLLAGFSIFIGMFFTFGNPNDVEFWSHIIIGLVGGVIIGAGLTISDVPPLSFYERRTFAIPTFKKLKQSISSKITSSLEEEPSGVYGARTASMMLGAMFGGLIGLLLAGGIGFIVLALISGLIAHKFGGVIDGVIESFLQVDNEPSDIHVTNKPVWQALKTALWLGGLSFFGLFLLRDVFGRGWILTVTLGFGMFWGGGNFIYHYILRLVLSYYHILPYPFSDQKLTAFLDKLTEGKLLLRVGGGWMFRHPYLLEYIASYHQDFKPRIKNGTGMVRIRL